MTRIIAGPRAVEEALQGHPDRISVIYYAGDLERSLGTLLGLAQRKRVRAESQTREGLEQLVGGVRHQGIVAISGEYPYAELDDLFRGPEVAPLIVALDQIQDPHNLGAIVRSTVALGAQGIITLKDRASPVTAVAVRASAGATERAAIVRVTNLARTLAQLRQSGIEIVGLAGEGQATVRELPFPPAGRVLVVGSEGGGLRPLVRKQCDVLARIEMPGPIASLNAAVAAGIAIYESCQQRGAQVDQSHKEEDDPSLR